MEPKTIEDVVYAFGNIQFVIRELTNEQKERGVVFSSALSVTREGDDDRTIHEVFDSMSEEDQVKMQDRLNDHGFFYASHYNYNIVRC
jgi:hypothetical protein